MTRNRRDRGLEKAETLSDADLQTVLPDVRPQGHTADEAAQVQAAPADQTLQLLSSLINSGILQLGPGFDAASLQVTVPNQEQGCEQNKAEKPDETAARASAEATPVQDVTEIPPGWSPTTAFKASLPAPRTETKSHDDSGPIDLTRKTVPPPPAHGGKSAQPVPKAPDALDLTTFKEVTEDIRGQLLEDPQAQTLDEDVRHVRARCEDPEAKEGAASPAHSTGSSYSSSSSSLAVEGHLEDIKKLVEDRTKTLENEVNSNSRTIRQLEKVIREQSEMLKTMQATLSTFVSYTRGYNREERRLQEKRDGDRKAEREEDLKKLETLIKCHTSKRKRDDDESPKENSKMKSVLGNVYPKSKKTKELNVKRNLIIKINVKRN